MRQQKLPAAAFPLLTHLRSRSLVLLGGDPRQTELLRDTTLSAPDLRVVLGGSRSLSNSWCACACR